MQTFFPYPDPKPVADCLDNRRCGKQRVEVYQILRVLAGFTTGWASHPAVKMWRNHALYLIMYGETICLEWQRRGYTDNMHAAISRFRTIEMLHPQSDEVRPYWLTGALGAAFCRAHQSNLVRKAPEYYRQYFPRVPDNLPYIWPVQ
jgi:hypothetical protein